MKGAKPKPTHLKLLRGNPGKRALPKDEPQPDHGADMPEWLSPEAAAHWPVVAKQLESAGVLTNMDGIALALYCESFARWRHAQEQIAQFGPVVKTPQGFPVQSPFLSIANKSWEQMTKLLIEFGMTPSSRTRVKVAKKPDDGNEKFKEFA
jgi:P27 family predicted phage terminase small subunit